MSFFDNLFSAFTAKPVTDAANKNTQLFNQNLTQGRSDLTTGYGDAKDAYGRGVDAFGNAINAWSPMSALAGQFGRGTNAYMDALGINGPAGNAAAVNAFQAGPGYQWMRDQALDASTRGAAARSMGGIGGNQLTALAGLGSNLANQEWGNHLGRLAGFGNQQLAAQGAASGGIASGYGGIAGLNNNWANTAMTHGQNLTNLGNTTASALSNINNVSAQGQMDASKNIWNLGKDAAKLFMGF